MAKRPSSEHTSIGGRLALGVLALLILAFYVAVGRLVAGSWRHFAALALAGATYLVGMLLLRRVSRSRTAAEWLRVWPAFPFVGAAAGGVYVLVSTASGIWPALYGFAWGLLHAWLVWRQTLKLAAEARAREAMAR
jgi:hypothetical protein